MSGLLNRLNALIGTKDHKPIKKTKITHKENFQLVEFHHYINEFDHF